MGTDLQGQDAEDLVGQRIGKYLIRRKIGQGGMGAVFEAVHEDIGQRAAIKVLRTEMADDPRAVQRFFSEARAISMVQHPGLVKIFDFNQLPGGAPYMMMEMLEGPSLWDRYKNLQLAGMWFTPEDVQRILRQLASALSAVHRKGIIHRDLKPENVILVADPESPPPFQERCKLLDFGIAVTDSAAARLTTANHVLGTPTYMAPEHCEGRADLDDRADVYSLGIMCYEMLAGNPPFSGDAVSVMRQHLFASPPPLPGGVPAPLCELVERMLAKERAERPAMEEVVQRLDLMDPWQSFRSGRVVVSAPFGSAGSAPFGSAGSAPFGSAGSAPRLELPTVAAPRSGISRRPGGASFASPPPSGTLPADANLAPFTDESSVSRRTPWGGAPRGDSAPRLPLPSVPIYNAGQAGQAGLPGPAGLSAHSELSAQLGQPLPRRASWHRWATLVLLGLFAGGLLWARSRWSSDSSPVRAEPMNVLRPAVSVPPGPVAPAAKDLTTAAAPPPGPHKDPAVSPPPPSPPVPKIPIFADKRRKGRAALLGDAKRHAE